VVADQALAEAGQAMTSTERALSTASEAVRGTVPSLRTLSQTVGTDVPRIIESTRRAILAAQSSATAIDAVIDGVSSVPLLGLSRYRPEKPLGASLGDVAASLEDLPDAVRDMQSGLDDSTDSAGDVRNDLNELARSLGGIGDSLEQARLVVADYRLVVDDLQEQAERAREQTPVWLGRLRWGAWFVLVWLAIAQIALITQGLELIARSRTGASS
jgi:methyl-accepting chemotaxis protein